MGMVSGGKRERCSDLGVDVNVLNGETRGVLRVDESDEVESTTRV